MSALPSPLPPAVPPAPSSGGPGSTPRRLLALAGLALAVLLAHAWLLAGLPLGLGGHGAEPARSVQVRQIVRPAPAELEAASTSPTPPTPAAAAPRPRPRPPVAEAPPESAARVPEEPVAVRPAEPAASAAPPPAPPPAMAEAPVAPAPIETPAVASAEAAAPTPGTAEGGEPMPTYATKLPPPTTLVYELRRGLLTGQGELHWRPGPEGYTLAIEGFALGLPVLNWSSQGRLDANGLAPERFVDQRRGRAGRSANFQRDRGVVSWSTTPAEAPLLPGAQDRLSFMVQLAAIVDAQPERFGPEHRIVMQVVGARGDVDAWAFVVRGREAVDVAGRRVEAALALRRVPRKPFDTEVDVWLDPARHHLPVRLRLATAGGGDSMEFLLAR